MPCRRSGNARAAHDDAQSSCTPTRAIMISPSADKRGDAGPSFRASPAAASTTASAWADTGGSSSAPWLGLPASAASPSATSAAPTSSPPSTTSPPALSAGASSRNGSVRRSYLVKSSRRVWELDIRAAATYFSRSGGFWVASETAKACFRSLLTAYNGKNRVRKPLRNRGGFRFSCQGLAQRTEGDLSNFGGAFRRKRCVSRTFQTSPCFIVVYRQYS